MTTALVLGAGGTVGMAYHAGVLRALEDVGGYRPDDADLIVGTSAGSMMGAMLRSGMSTEDMFLASLGEHPDIALEPPNDESPWSRAFEGPADVVRRLFGSMYVLQRSMLRIPTPHLPRGLQRLFPGGFFTIAGAEETLTQVIPSQWPAKPLWLVTVDVRTGRRVVLGRRNPPRTDLQTAVKASCAIPAFFQPIRVGRRTLVDGGVHSTTNIDLANKVTPELLIAVVPMGHANGAEVGGVDRMMRAPADRAVATEVEQVRRRGGRVLVIRPTSADLDAFGGPNMMRRDANERVTLAAYESTAQLLRTDRARELLAPHVRTPVDA